MLGTLQGAAVKPMRQPILIACTLLIAGCQSLPPARPPVRPSLAVIPVPASVTRLEGSFTVSVETTVLGGTDPEAQWIARYFSDLVQKSRGITFSLNSRPGAPLIEFALDPRAEGSDPESYTLVIEPKRIHVAAHDRRGLFYGAITLWQLVTATEGAAGEVKLGAMRIADSPRFHWRGVMLDSARHFQQPEEIERFLDGMASTKLNVLHWHLTDDQGWRLEIRKYPRLTDVGEAGIFPDLEPPALVVRQVPVQDVQLGARHAVEEAFDFLGLLKMARRIEHDAAPVKSGTVRDPHGAELYLARGTLSRRHELPQRDCAVEKTSPIVRGHVDALRLDDERVAFRIRPLRPGIERKFDQGRAGSRIEAESDTAALLHDITEIASDPLRFGIRATEDRRFHGDGEAAFQPRHGRRNRNDGE